MLFAVPPNMPNNMPRQQNEVWTDVLSRCITAANLILDTTPGMLNMMLASTGPGQQGDEPEFGDEITALARQLLA